MRKIWIIIIAVIILGPIVVYAWNDCPYGLIDDPFPGSCPRYTDTNNNDICDHSESPTDGTVDTNIQTTTNTSKTISVSDENSKGRGRNGGEGEDISKVSKELISQELNTKQNYYLFPLVLVLTLSYIISYLFYRNKKLRRITYRKIWNLVLIASLLGTGITGIMLIFLINQGLQTYYNLTITFLHGISAIIMTVTTVFHVHIYWKQLK